MKKKREKSSILDVLLMMLLIVLFTGVFVAGLLGGMNIGSLLLGALALFLTWALMKDLRHGVRSPTRWEWFKAWMIMRPVIIAAIGLALLMLLVTTNRSAFVTDSNTFGMLMVALVLIWCGLIFYTILRAPHRQESDETYKKRMDWKDSEEPL
jgi:hypothetical protein